ncbi:MAG: futalosine hydrolase [Chitinophagaceae bacterium]
MNCLVIAATAKEISPFIDFYKSNPKKNIDILITGIGLTATTYSLLKQLQIKKPDLVLQAGVGGCFDKTLPLGKVVLVKKEAIADQSVVELKSLKTIFDLQLLPQNQFPFQKGWLVNKSKILDNVRLKKVNAISVNEITTQQSKAKLYTEYFHPVIESMEGAALHYVSILENIPFLQIRAVSNYIGERNKKKWNMNESILNLNKELIKIVDTQL